MAHNESTSTEEESLKKLFEDGMKLYEKIENGREATNSDGVQMDIRTAISKFEKATNLVSLAGIFSKNESIEELPTEILGYLLLPALLGTLSLKLCGQPRKDVVTIADIYFRDFLQRCKDYGVTKVEIPKPSASQTAVGRQQSNADKITNMVHSRQIKIEKHLKMKELREKLNTLSKAMSSTNFDEETKRQYFTTLLLIYVDQAIDELGSIDEEKTLLEYMYKNAGASKPPKREHAPLKPVIITRDAIQKAVYGAGYPALPTMTVEEFYDKRVREGTFPSASNIPHSTIQSGEADADEGEQIRRERLVEDDDEEELMRQRALDEYKDFHRRGWGNRHNRS